MASCSRANASLLRLMVQICITLKTLDYGNYGIFLIMGNAGFIPSTVARGLGFRTPAATQ